LNKLKKILSYVYPIQVHACSSKYNSFLEVILSKGRYQMNSRSANYSFGGLHTLFQNTFRDIEIEALNISNCLLLGLGGGSVINLIRKKHELNFPITAVELDPLVIELGNKYFDVCGYNNLSVVNDDAFNFVRDCSGVYDLIIIDIYINDEVPGKFHTKEFISGLENISHANTIILFNKMLKGRKSEPEYSNLVCEMTRAFGTVGFLSYTINDTENKIICVNASRLHSKAGNTKESRVVNLPVRLLKPRLN